MVNASADAAELVAARPGASPSSRRARLHLADGDQCDSYRDHGNPQGGCTNIRDEHGSSEEHQRDSNLEEQTLHDGTSIRP